MPGTTQTGGDICERRRAEIAGQVVSGTLSIQQACAQHQLSPELLLEWVAAFRQASLAAFDEQVRRTLAEQGIDVSALASAEFHGDLGELTIADLLQTLALGARDGLITVSHEGEESRIWCAAGEVMDAESGRLSGSAALYRMLALSRGRVHARFHRVQRTRRVHASLMELLLEGARRSDECRALRERLGSERYRATARASELPATAAEAALLATFQPGRIIDEALAESELGDVETLTLVSHLVERGWLLAGSEKGSETSPRRSAPELSSPPLVMSLARFPTQPATPRARKRWALGLGLLALATLGLPPCLLAARAMQRSPERAAAAAQARPAAESTRATVAERDDAAGDTAVQLPAEPAPPTGTDAALASAERPAPRLSAARSLRLGSTRAAATAAVTAAASPARAAAQAAPRPGAAPRMQLIEARRPQMQILE